MAEEIAWRPGGMGIRMHRYTPVFGTGRGMVASAAAFNPVAARRLVEHALDGLLVFTVGLGGSFYHGAGS